MESWCSSTDSVGETEVAGDLRGVAAALGGRDSVGGTDVGMLVILARNWRCVEAIQYVYAHLRDSTAVY